MEKLNGILARNPKDVGALTMLGMIYSQKGESAKALETYEKLLAINPQFSSALNNLAYLYAERLGRLEDAHKMARRARELLPHDPFTADTLGWILYRRGEYSWAVNLLQESADKMPANPDIQLHLGLSL